MICASLALLHPLLSLTHWIFRSLMLPYKSSSHSANHVRCASTGKRVTRFSGRFAPLRIVFPCHRGIGRATKGKRLYGQARRLTSPDLHILCRMCTVDNKAPQSNPFTQRIAKNKVPPPGERWWRQPPKGVHFRRPQGGCMVLYKPAPSII